MSFRHATSYTPSPLRGSLLHGKACHWILRSLSLPYESSSFATLKGTQGRYGIYFSVSYDMKTILLTGSLRSPPPIRLRRTFPHPGDRINRSTFLHRVMWHTAEHP